MTETEKKEAEQRAVERSRREAEAIIEARREGFGVFYERETKSLNVNFSDMTGRGYEIRAGELDDIAEVFAGWFYSFDLDKEAAEAFADGFGSLSQCYAEKKRTAERIRKFSDYCRGLLNCQRA